MRGSVWTAAWAVGALLIGALGGPARAASLEEARAELERATRACAKDLADLGRWCERKEHAGAAARFRAEALWFRPDDAKLRKELGWEEQAGQWVLPAEARERFLATALGQPFPEDETLAKKLDKVREKAGRRLRDVVEAAAPPEGASDEEKAAIEAIRAEALELLLRTVPGDADAQRALGFVEHGGRLVHADAIPFLEARAEQAAVAKGVVGRDVEATDNTPENSMPRAATDSLMVTSSAGITLARSAVVRATQVLRVLEHVYDLPEAFRSHVQRRDLIVVDSEEQHQNVAAQMYQRKLPQVVRTDVTTLQRYGKQTLLVFETDAGRATEILTAAGTREGVATLFRLMLDRVPEAERKIEAWVQDAITMDVLGRATGQIHPTIGIELREHLAGSCRSADDWLERARLQCLHGLDPGIREVAAKGPWEVGGEHLAKGYAFLRFLHELDAKKAQGFVYVALVQGAATAATTAFERPLDELETEYRRWVLIAQ